MAIKLKSNFRIILAGTSVSIFSLIVLFNSTLAWFTSTRNANNSTGDIPISVSRKVLTNFKLYGVIREMGTDGQPLPLSIEATEYNFSSTPTCTMVFDYDNNKTIVTGDPSFELGTYSLLDSIHPVLGIFEIESNYNSPTVDQPLSLGAITSEEFVGDQDEGGTFINELNKVDNPLSSIVYFNCFGLDNLTPITSGDNFVVSKSRIESSTRSSFVEFDENFEQSTFTKNIDLYTATSGTINYICVLFNYFDEAIEYIYTVYLGHDVVTGAVGDASLPFSCDFKFSI